MAVDASAPAVRAAAEQVRANIARVIVGKQPIVELLLVALLCEGHVLLEDVPGTGKTTLARALACSIDCEFRRIQFTPDLLPTDVTGLSYLQSEARRVPVPPRRDLHQMCCWPTRSTARRRARRARCSRRCRSAR